MRLIPVLDFGGVETIFALQSRLVDHARFDFRVCTFWKKGAAARAIEASGVQVDCLDVDPSIRNPRATRALYGYLRRVRPDIVHASIGEANFHTALVAKLARVKAIMEEQGLPNRKLPARLVHALLYRNVDAIVGVSNASCRYVVEREFAPRDRVRRIYNCAKPEFFTPHERPPRTDPRFTVLTVGRLVAVKNHLRLVRAFRKVVDSHPDVILRIVGDGPLRAELETLLADLGLSQQVELLGFRDDVLELLLSADLLVLPSLSEGFGIALAEAMALSVPVIGSNVGAIPEVMGELGSEWLVPAEDEAAWAQTIQRMIELPPSERAVLGERARVIASKFSPESNLRSLEELYLDLLHS